MSGRPETDPQDGMMADLPVRLVIDPLVTTSSVDWK
jgi:hypothetical protein